MQRTYEFIQLRYTVYIYTHTYFYMGQYREIFTGQCRDKAEGGCGLVEQRKTNSETQINPRWERWVTDSKWEAGDVLWQQLASETKQTLSSQKIVCSVHLQIKMLRKKCWWSETKPTLSIQRIILFTQQAGVCLECCVVSAGKSVVRVLCCIDRQVCS